MNRLVKYLSIVLKWRKFIFWNTFVVTLLAVAISFLLPLSYASVARVLPPPENDLLGMSSILGGGLSAGRLGRLRAGAMLGGSTPSDLMVGILGSRTIMSNVVARCSVIPYYRIRRNSMELAVKRLRKMTTLVAGDDGIVTIRVMAKTPALAASIANCYVDELDNFLRTSNMSQGRNTRVFLERRLGEVAAELALANDSLRVFQQRHKTVTVSEETKAAIETYAKLKAQLYARQAELAAAERVGGPDNPYVARLRGEVEAFELRVGALERGDGSSGYGIGFSVAFEDLPDVGLEFARRLRDAKIQDETYAMLYEQFEYAKVLEARDTPALSVLDRAVPPERKSRPRRAMIVLIGFLASFLLGIFSAVFFEYLEGLQAANPEAYRAWREVAVQIRSLFSRTTAKPGAVT